MTFELDCFRNFSIPTLFRNYSGPIYCTKIIAMPRRRIYNYLLLLFLVFSGLAGTPTDDVLSKKERKYAADHMKGTKASFQEAIKGLSEAQVNFKASADKWSIKECVYHIAVSEKTLWSMLEVSMKSAATPEKKKDLKFTDEDIIKRMENREEKRKTLLPLDPQNSGYDNFERAVNDFKVTRTAHIKYIKATSQDMRNHFVQMPFGMIDCYQLCLMISAHTNRHISQLNEIKADPNFPK
jgi:hypothetical protein